VVVKKPFRYSKVFSYNHLYQPECFYEKRYKMASMDWQSKIKTPSILNPIFQPSNIPAFHCVKTAQMVSMLNAFK